FAISGISTHFLRLDWSPDGTSLTGVHSLNNGGPVAKIIQRNTWNYNNEFVGHRKAVTCTRFSPTMYEIVQNFENGSSKIR
uniref:Uncharacterized protein n=1 Tax=Romanomermis culicivorax TaxID=13658 RepID=A0A915I1Z2_ROMCU